MWLIYHILAICLPPLTVPPTSLLLRSVSEVFRPYLQALYLHHGFHYFAPEPGESSLVAFTVEREDGATVNGIMPHRRIWPRQLYHRHFMLTESLSFVPDHLREQWYESYARCLARQYNGREVQLARVIHYLASPEMVLDGMTLDHPDRYERIDLGVYQRDAK